jgi:energy-coupling factor transporter ATP-binding protein EcfA2
MIKSVKFTGENGYIVDKIPEPGCDVRGMEYRKDFSDEEKEAIKQYRKEMRYWRKHKDEYDKPHLVKNLLGREFKFTEGINLIFGPNACGKTTILKAIAGKAGTTDGFARLFEPIELKHGFMEEITTEVVLRKINNLMKNSAEIDWDGAPVFFHNFENRKNFGQCGDLLGSVLGDSIVSEVEYVMNKDQISKGQNSFYLLKKLAGIAKKHTCYQDLFSSYINADGTYTNKVLNNNDTWQNAFKVQLDYYLSFEKSKTPCPITMLFDEVDKSMDILNVFLLYTEVLPMLVEKTGVQIILVSHNPLVLLDKIRESVNFISIDEQYTDECLKLVNQFK